MPFGPFARRSIRPRARAVVAPRVEALDPRQLLAVAGPSVVMLSATTQDSQGVTITYDVAAPQTAPITLGVYRSADANLDAGDTPVGSTLTLPSVDSTGASLAAVGQHTVTVPIAGGLPIDPARPYVVVVTDPDANPATSNDAPSAASFRKYSIAVVTHGGIQDTAWKKNGPPWILYMAQELKAEGYDQAIPFNWVAASNTPGSAAKQGPSSTPRPSFGPRPSRRRSCRPGTGRTRSSTRTPPTPTSRAANTASRPGRSARSPSW